MLVINQPMDNPVGPEKTGAAAGTKPMRAKKDGLGGFGKILQGLLKSVKGAEKGPEKAPGGAKTPQGLTKDPEAALLAGQDKKKTTTLAKINLSSGKNRKNSEAEALEEKAPLEKTRKKKDSLKEGARSGGLPGGEEGLKPSGGEEFAASGAPGEDRDRPLGQHRTGWESPSPNLGNPPPPTFEPVGSIDLKNSLVSLEGAETLGALKNPEKGDLRLEKGEKEIPEDKGKKPAKEKAKKPSVELLDTRKGEGEGMIPSSLEKTQERGDAPIHETELLVDLKSQARSQAQVSLERDERGSVSFQDMLRRELHENLNGDIVRQAQIVLRDSGEGLIRLSLRPESLGNVKIRLEMTENKIAGRIVVDSEEAYHAFEQEIRSLEQAFKDSGFEGAALELSSRDGAFQGRSEAGDQGRSGEASPLFPYRASRYEGFSAEDEGHGIYQGIYDLSSRVNVLV